MAMVATKQHVPIFVGSTFSDLKAYRRAVRDALSQLETIVRGMEYFGSKPGTPVEECLRVVASCKIYIGVFGMRYGSLPDGNDRSMTHLEYDEAQRLQLPSLVYLIDEEAQPVLPKDVETGDGAEKLRELKEELRRKHMVSLFTTPDDLAGKILHDVPEVLGQIGAKIEGALPHSQDINDLAILAQFEALPKIFRGKELTVEFLTQGSFRSAHAEPCQALGLEIGATVVDRISLTTGNSFRLFAQDDAAVALSTLPKGSKIRARVVTGFGVYKRVDYSDDGAHVIPEVETGLIVQKILSVAQPDSPEDQPAG